MGGDALSALSSGDRRKVPRILVPRNVFNRSRERGYLVTERGYLVTKRGFLLRAT
jgi:hypothetical protein